MGKGLLPILHLLIVIQLCNQVTGSCIVERDVSSVNLEQTSWDTDYYDYDSRIMDDDSRIFYEYHIICNNATLKPEESLLHQISGRHTQEAHKANRITLIKSKINHISSVFMTNIISVSNLYLNNSNIASIDPDALNMSDLLNLHLENNSLTEIKNGTFRKLSNVKEIYLQNNQIKFVDSFSYCKSLVQLNISYNNINAIEEYHFKNLSNLSKLYLMHNNISTIHPNAFSNSTRLQEIHLEDNALKTLPNSLFENISSIDLFLSNNYLQNFSIHISKINNTLPKLSRYHYLPPFISVYRIELSNNSLTDIPKILSNNQLELYNIYLYLNNNNIKSIRSNNLNHTETIVHLLLQQNQIDTIELGAFREFTSLLNLNLSHNKLKELIPGMFTGLSSLRYLDLSHNELIHFDATVFFPLKSLRQLNYSGNYLYSLDTTAFYSPVLRFTTISFDFHHISCHTLMQYLHAFKLHGITVQKGNTFDTENIDGIACEHTKRLHHHLTSTTSATSTVSTVTTTSGGISTISQDITIFDSTTARPDENILSTTNRALNITDISSADFSQSEPSKTSHVLLITSIALLIGTIITGIAFWFGRKYYQKRLLSVENESQYKLVNIRDVN